MEENDRVPIWHKLTLTVDEAAAYSGIGKKKIREISNADNDFVMYINSKKVINRKKLERFLEANTFI